MFHASLPSKDSDSGSSSGDDKYTSDFVYESPGEEIPLEEVEPIPRTHICGVCKRVFTCRTLEQNPAEEASRKVDLNPKNTRNGKELMDRLNCRCQRQAYHDTDPENGFTVTFYHLLCKKSDCVPVPVQPETTTDNSNNTPH